jgi:hypothetical protein
MALSLMPQPKSVKTLVGNFDFKEVDAVYLSKRATPRTRESARLLAEELRKFHHLNYEFQVSANITDPRGCLVTHHTRGAVFVKTLVDKPQGYEILAAGHTLAISAFDDGGFHHATRTIRQLLQEGTRIPALKIQDWPTVPFRAVHLDLKGLTPNPASLREFIERVALHKFSAVLVEYDDRFPYECLPDVRGPHAFTRESLREFVAETEGHGLEIIPLFNCLGGLESLLTRKPYRGLAEAGQAPSQICPANPKAERLLREMLHEVLAAHPHSRLVLLGTGDAKGLGQNPLSKAAMGKLGGAQGLLLEHLGKFIRMVKAAGRSTLLSLEHLRDVPLDKLRKLPKGLGLIYPCYEPSAGQFRAELLPGLGEYRQAGFPVYGASAVRGVPPYYSNVPNYRDRLDNVDWWIEASETHGPFAGHFLMAPSRLRRLLTPCDPLPVAWPVILYGAERTWAGLDSSRESFERRLLVGFYGLRAELAEVALAHYGVAEEHAEEAGEVLANAKQQARRNRDVLELLELLAALECFARERQRTTELVAASLPRLERGCADPALVLQLKSRLPGLLQELERLRNELSRSLLKRFDQEEVEEFIQDRLLVSEWLLAYLQTALKRHP